MRRSPAGPGVLLLFDIFNTFSRTAGRFCGFFIGIEDFSYI